MPDAAEPNPTVDRRELAVFFRNLREQRKRTLDELAAVLQIDRSHASRLDTGARGFRPEDVTTLSRWYGLGSDKERRLVALAVGSSKRAWWQQAKIAPAYRTLIGMERAAISINEFCNSVVPGLLQTRSYAEAIMIATDVRINPKQARDAAAARLRRQDILARSTPPELSVVLDEAVLARGAGGPHVMMPQLQHLLRLASHPAITIQVIDFESGAYPASEGQFILLHMPRGLPDVFYGETLLGSRDTSDAAALDRGWRLWRELQITALSPQRSSEVIKRYAEHYSSLREAERNPNGPGFAVT